MVAKNIMLHRRDAEHAEVLAAAFRWTSRFKFGWSPCPSVGTVSLAHFSEHLMATAAVPRAGIHFITHDVIGAAIEVHRHLGPGLLESAYLRCLSDELTRCGLVFDREVPLALHYKGRQLDCGYRLDLIVAGCVIVETKAVDKVLPIHEAQLLTYLKLARLPLGLLINFNVPRLTAGITRIVNRL
jgi:GxxExxY protein